MASQMNKYYLSPMLRYITINQPEFVLGYYVYEYRDCNTIFYVGMGRNRRAWNQHLPPPQERREAATLFRVNIVRHGLTKKQAHLIERHHIASLVRRNVKLLNTRIPSKV